MKINVLFTNFWERFDNISWFNYWIKIFQHPQINWENNLNEQPDLLVSSVFGSIDIIKNFKCKKILYTRENLNHKHYHQFQSNLNLFDFVIGFNDHNNEINIPYFYRVMIERNINNLKCELLCDKTKDVCLISRNPHYLRLKLLDSFQKNKVIVDCPGGVGKNMDIFVKDKINFIKNYYFNICPENSYADGYITEKLFECCLANCIPIYYGCEKLNDGFYNKDRILHIKQDLSNYDEIIDKAIHLINNKKNLLEFMNKNCFAPNYNDYINQIQNKIKIKLEQLFL